MDKQLKASITYNGYIIEKIDYKLNNQFVANKQPIHLDYDFDVHINLDNENSSAIIKIECIIFKEYKECNGPFYLDIIINGFFTYDSNEDEKAIHNLLSNNAVAIVFPYLRSIIGSITVNCGIAPVTLPTINIIEFMKRKTQEKEATLETEQSS